MELRVLWLSAGDAILINVDKWSAVHRALPQRRLFFKKSNDSVTATHRISRRNVDTGRREKVDWLRTEQNYSFCDEQKARRRCRRCEDTGTLWKGTSRCLSLLSPELTPWWPLTLLFFIKHRLSVRIALNNSEENKKTFDQCIFKSDGWTLLHPG